MIELSAGDLVKSPHSTWWWYPVGSHMQDRIPQDANMLVVHVYNVESDKYVVTFLYSGRLYWVSPFTCRDMKDFTKIEEPS